MLPRTWLGWVVYLVGGAVALALGGLALLFFMLPRAELKAEFERRLEAEIGRDVTIAGDFGASFFPVLGFHADEVTIANVAGGQSLHLAKTASMAAGVEFLPLVLRRQVVVTSLVFREPDLALEVAADGRPNWNLTRPVQSGGQTPPQQTTPPQQQPGGAQAPAQIEDFRLRSLRIEGGRISYRDARDNGAWQIDDPELETAITGLDEPVQIKGALGFRGQRLNIDLTIAQPRRVLQSQTTPIVMSIESELLNARLDGQAAGVGEWYVGQAQASGPSVRRISAWLGAPITGGGGFESFEVDGRLTTQQGRIAFENATLRLDATRARGDFVLEAHGVRPYISGRLELPQFDMNPFLVPMETMAQANAASAGEGEAQVAETAAIIASAPETQGVDMRRPWDTRPIDGSGFRAVDANVELYTGRFTFQRMSADSAMVSMVVNEGFMAATLHRMTLYGGSGRGRMSIDAREIVLGIDQELHVEGVRAQDFLRDAVGYDGLEGPANVDLSMVARGANQDAIIQSLDGRVRLSMTDGALKGVDLGGVARTIQRAISGDLINPNARTRFSSMSGNFAIADGVMATSDFRVNTSDLRIDGVGLLNLSAQTMNMRIVPREGGIAIPFVVCGPWAQLQYNSDLRGRERAGIQEAVTRVQANAPVAR